MFGTSLEIVSRIVISTGVYVETQVICNKTNFGSMFYQVTLLTYQKKASTAVPCTPSAAGAKGTPGR